MSRDITLFLWLLKLGALLNLYFLIVAGGEAVQSTNLRILVSAQILFAVSAFRCLFPVRYKDNVVLHDTVFSSIFLTRLLATFSEVAFIYLFSEVLRVLNTGEVLWVTAFSWAMVAQVLVSQGFVWWAILSRRLVFYYYEEIGWGVIFALNTICSAYLYATLGDMGGSEVLLWLNLAFGLAYLPWQFLHLRALKWDSKGARSGSGEEFTIAEGLRRALWVRNPSAKADAWGGWIGIIWMTSYWATLIPSWLYYVLGALDDSGG